MLKIAKFSLGPLETNCYLVHDDCEAVVMDPGGPAGSVLDYCRQHGLKLTHILLTHLHFDHTGGVAALTAATGASVLGSNLDRYMLDNEMGRGGVWGMPLNEPYTFTDLGPGELPLLGTACRVLATPGHSPGSLSFYFTSLRAVFCGDVLFYRSVGRTDFEGSSHPALMASLRERLFTLPAETTVYSGHGPATSIGDEKNHNPYAGDCRQGRV